MCVFAINEYYNKNSTILSQLFPSIWCHSEVFAASILAKSWFLTESCKILNLPFVCEQLISVLHQHWLQLCCCSMSIIFCCSFNCQTLFCQSLTVVLSWFINCLERDLVSGILCVFPEHCCLINDDVFLNPLIALMLNRVWWSVIINLFSLKLRSTSAFPCDNVNAILTNFARDGYFSIPVGFVIPIIFVQYSSILRYGLVSKHSVVSSLSSQTEAWVLRSGWRILKYLRSIFFRGSVFKRWTTASHCRTQVHQNPTPKIIWLFRVTSHSAQSFMALTVDWWLLSCTQ